MTFEATPVHPATLALREATSFAALPPLHSRARVWSGRILSGVLVAFFTFDALGKILLLQPVVDACAKLGLGTSAAFAIGVVLALCTLLYVVPRTATLGALLLTGYLGGAICLHVLHFQGAFPIAFAFSFGVLTWVGLGLRDERVRALVAPRAR